MSRQAAACSRVRPPKKRSSTSLALSGSWSANCLQGLVQGQELLRRPAGAEGVEFRVLAPPSAAVLLAPLAAGILDQDAAHGLGGGGEEVPAAVPAPILRRADEPEVRLVDQGGGLERLAGPLPGQPMRGQPAELVVDQRQELIGRSGVALLDGREDAGDVVHRRGALGQPTDGLDPPSGEDATGRRYQAAGSAAWVFINVREKLGRVRGSLKHLVF